MQRSREETIRRVYAQNDQSNDAMLCFGATSVTSLLLLRPQLLRAQLARVVDRTCAMRSLYITRVVHLRVDTVTVSCIGVWIVILLIAVNAIMRRLPAQRSGEMWAVGTTV